MAFTGSSCHPCFPVHDADVNIPVQLSRLCTRRFTFARVPTEAPRLLPILLKLCSQTQRTFFSLERILLTYFQSFVDSASRAHDLRAFSSASGHPVVLPGCLGRFPTERKFKSSCSAARRLRLDWIRAKSCQIRQTTQPNRSRQNAHNVAECFNPSAVSFLHILRNFGELISF